MTTYINENVRVGAIFGGGHTMRPAWFIWHGRNYRIQEVTYHWTSTNGASRIHHFSVTDTAGDLFELRYTIQSMAWLLVQIECA